MIKTQSYNISEFQKLEHQEFAFITCASFEERVLIIPYAFKVEQIRKAYIITTNATPQIRENSNKLNVFFENKGVVKQVIKNDPFSYIQCFSSVINEIVQEQYKTLYIDITTFTHEMLLILLKVIDKKKDLFDNIEFLYIGASEYSVGDIKEKKWLSKGCKDIRNILGYPGFLVPKRQTCLIILVGFEHERATALINEMEPDRILLGCGQIECEQVLSENHIEPMCYFRDLYGSLFASRDNIQSFDFSVKDVESTIDTIKKQIEITKEYDHILVPLNTKMSTLAVGLLALENASIQVCYAEPEMYNNENYSQAGDVIVSYSLK